MERISYVVLGESKSGTIDDLRQDAVMLGKKAMSADRAADQARRDLLAAMVAWGAVLIQARPLIPDRGFIAWVTQCGCGHRNKAHSAIKVASRLADAHGQLDKAKLRDVIERYNKECVGREGFVPLSLNASGSASVRTAEYALGMRSQSPSARRARHSEFTASDRDSARRAVQSDDLSDDVPIDFMDLAMGLGPAGKGGGRDNALGGGQVGDQVGARGGASQPRAEREESPGDGHAQPGEGGDGRDDAALKFGNTGAWAGPGERRGGSGSQGSNAAAWRATSPGPAAAGAKQAKGLGGVGGGVGGQMTLVELFQAAERVRHVADLIASGDLDAETVSRVLAICDQVERAGGNAHA